MAKRLPEAEHARRAEAVRTGTAAGWSWTRIADELGVSQAALADWRERHSGRWLPAAETAPTRSAEIPKSDRLRVQPVGHAWLVECGPCGRRWTRPSERRARDLAVLHLRMHRPRPVAPRPGRSRAVAPPASRAEALTLLAAGHTPAHVAEQIGVHIRTVQRWQKAARQETR